MPQMPLQPHVHPVEDHIILIRGLRVMLSSHLARLYGVETRALNQAVQRKIRRFPPDFMFRLTTEEANALVSQSVIPDARSLGGSPPLAFTEHGVAMLSSVLRSPRAIAINIEIGGRCCRCRRRELSSQGKQQPSR